MMVRRCLVCASGQLPGSILSFHRFPKDEARRLKWLQACNCTEDVPYDAIVCSKHFLLRDYDYESIWPRKRLLETAVPVLGDDYKAEPLKSSTVEQQAAVPDLQSLEKELRCLECDICFKEKHYLYNHLFHHIKQPSVVVERLILPSLKVTFKCRGGDKFEIVNSNSPTSEEYPEFTSDNNSAFCLPAMDTDSGNDCDLTIDQEEQNDDMEKMESLFLEDDAYDQPDNEGGDSAIAITDEDFAQQMLDLDGTDQHDERCDDVVDDDGNYTVENDNDVDDDDDEGCEVVETMSEHSSSATSPSNSNNPDYPRIRIRNASALMNDDPLSITEILDDDDHPQVQRRRTSSSGDRDADHHSTQHRSRRSSSAHSSSSWDKDEATANTNDSDSMLSSLLNNLERAKDLGFTSSDSDFISMDEYDERSSSNSLNTKSTVVNSNHGMNNAVQLYNRNETLNNLVNLPMEALAQQVSRLQPAAAAGAMHQQNVLINIQQFPQAAHPQQPPPQHYQPPPMYHHQPPMYQPYPYAPAPPPPRPAPIYYPPVAYTTPQQMPPPHHPAHVTVPHNQSPMGGMVGAPQQMQTQPPHPQQHAQPQRIINQQHPQYAQQTSRQPMNPQHPQHSNNMNRVGVIRPPQNSRPRMMSNNGPSQYAANQLNRPRGPVMRHRLPAPVPSIPNRSMIRPGTNVRPMKRTPEQLQAMLLAKRKRLDVLTPDKDDDDCQVICAQPKNADGGIPQIQSVQGGTSEQLDNIMHLSDSITLSVRNPPNKSDQPPNKSDAKTVANILATRGITVTAAIKSKDKGSTSSDGGSSSAPSSPKGHNPTSSPPASINLNGAVSIIPSSKTTGTKNNPATSNIAAQSKTITPTVDLTEEGPPTSILSAKLSSPLPPKPNMPPPNVQSNLNPSMAAGSPSGQTPSRALAFRCDLCPAQYPNALGLSRHRQTYHKTGTGSAISEMGVPLINLKQPGVFQRLNALGVHAYIPLPMAGSDGIYALPIITGVGRGGLAAASALGASSMLMLGPARSIPRPMNGTRTNYMNSAASMPQRPNQ